MVSDLISAAEVLAAQCAYFLIKRVRRRPVSEDFYQQAINRRFGSWLHALPL
jgi:hypothetical protein